MDSKVDFLLKEHPIEYVVQVQKKIKTDIEHKKDDLRTLIGERYNELLEATQSIDDMKCSVDAVISSLKDLNNILQSDFNDDSSSFKPKSNVQSCLSDILLDLPMKIWNLLHAEKISEATFHYFVGIHCYNVLERDNNPLLEDQMHLFNRMTLEDMNSNLVIKAWSLIEEKFKSTKICENDICEILLSLLIVKRCDLSTLVNEIYSRQTASLSCTIKLSSSFEYEQILNIVYNTIISSKLFHFQPNEISIENLFNHILENQPNFDINFGRNEHLLRKYFNFSYKDYFQAQKIQFSYPDNDQALEKWMTIAEETIKTSLQNAQKNSVRIREIYDEIIQTERHLIDQCRFADWREIDQFDIQHSIWNGCIKDSFQVRVFKVVDDKTDSLLKSISNILSSSQKDIKNSDLSIISSVWNNGQQKAKCNKILDICLDIQTILDNEFNDLVSELSILEKDFQNILSEICKRTDRFFKNIQQNIRSLSATKEYSYVGALLFRDLKQKCPSLMKMFSFGNKTIQEDFYNELFNISCEFYNDWFEHRIDVLLQKFDNSSYSELDKFLGNLTVWDKITITGEDGKESILEIPLQLSLSTYDLLIELSREINQFCVHSLPKNVLIKIFSFLGKKFLQITLSSLTSIADNSSLPASVKQTMSIQLYFDLLFLKNLFSTSKNDVLRKEVITTISEQLIKLEALIDPFDLHLMLPYMKINTEKLNRSCGLLLAFLRTDRNDFRLKSTSKQDNLSANDSSITNTMWLHSCQNDLIS